MRKDLIVPCGLAVIVAAWMAFRDPGPGTSQGPGSGAGIATSRSGLDAAIAWGRKRVAADPGDGEAAVRQADLLMRGARVGADASLSIEAERVLRATLQHAPSDYLARRMLSVVYLSQHRFADALQAATRAQQIRPQDAWNYAVAGDALLELGRYEEAFDAFDKAMTHRPDAGTYARVAYARELQGDLAGALRLMQMSAEATSRQDVEALAWTRAQIGSVYLQQDRLDEAEREFNHADFIFPAHPYAMNGRVRLLIARHRFSEALELSRRVPATPESIAIQGDLLARLGHPDEAETSYREVERLEREGWKQEEPQPAALARFLAERGRSIPEAVALAERAAGERQDVFTMDALAWSYFRAGRVADAAAAMQRATRLGTVDPRIRCHAWAISSALSTSAVQPDTVCDPLDVRG
jgi:tetratricopeptide (TPR) repeat protein